MIIILFVISQWMSFFNPKEVYDMVNCGDSLLIGTTSGALIFNKKDTSFTNITNVDGLLSNEIPQVGIDPYGNFWFLCSGGGITVMKGNKRKNFTSMENLPSYELSSLFIDGDTIWVGTSDDTKVWMYNIQGDPFAGGNGKLFDIKPTNEIKCIQVIDDSIWFGTNNGIGVMKKGETSFQVYNTESGLPNDTVLAIASWGGYIWAGTMKGIARRDSSEWVWVDSNYWCPSENDTIWMKGYNFYGNETGFWAATSFGARKWEGWGFNSIPDSWWDSRALVYDSVLWMGTFGNGVAKYDGTLSYYTPEGPSSNVFSSISTDIDGNLWSTHGSGNGWAVSKLYQEGIKWKWKTYNNHNEWGIGLWGSTSALLSDKKNNVWVTMWDCGDMLGIVKIMPNDSIIKFRIDGGGNSNCITASYMDNTDNLWIGCLDGYIRRIKNDIIDTTIYNENTKYVQAISMDTDGNLWVGERGSGLWIFLKTGEFSRISGIPNEPINFIKSFDKEMWIGTNSDIYKVVDRKVTTIYTKIDMGGVTQDITKDPMGGIWFVVKDYGIKRLTPTTATWEQYSIEDGLVNKEVLKLNFDNKLGVLWIGTQHGLSRFETEVSLPEIEFKVYPNPFVFSKHAGEKITFEETSERTFEKINIYTLSGRKIRSIYDSVTWDIRNENNKLVGSGIYIFVIHTKDGERKIGKIAVVR